MARLCTSTTSSSCHMTVDYSMTKYSRLQWFVLAMICSAYFAAAICEKIMAPFYPQAAESKNATATEYGFVFGIYDLVSFGVSPLLGNVIDKIGAKLIIMTGSFVTGVSTILFGVLDNLEGHTSFVVCSFALRITQAVGTSAVITSAYTILAHTFPDTLSTTYATLEVFYGLGLIVGPTLGGVLYAEGGYILPFIVMGSVFLLVGVLIYWVLPPIQNNHPKIQGQLLEVFKVPAVLLDSLSITSFFICGGFYSATLEPHVRRFKLKPETLGLVFLMQGATYVVGAPIVGHLSNTKVSPRHVILTGHVLTILSVALVGPPPFVPVDPSLPLVLTGLAFYGLGMACVVVAGFTDGIRSVVEAGFPDGIATYGLVSGLLAAALSLGNFLGPSIGGFLDDLVGFRSGSLIIIAAQMIAILARVITSWWRLRSVQKQDGKEAETEVEMEIKKVEPSSQVEQPFGSYRDNSGFDSNHDL